MPTVPRIGRQPQTKTFAGLKCTATPLSFPLAEANLAEVAELVGIVFDRVAPLIQSGAISLDMDTAKPEDLMKLLPLLSTISRHLKGDVLPRLAPVMLSGVMVAFPIDAKGTLENRDLGNAGEREEVLDQYPELYLPLVFWSGMVTYRRFFPGSVLPAAKTQG